MAKASLIFLISGLLGQVGGFLLTGFSSRLFSVGDFAEFALFEAYVTIIATLSILAVDRAAQRFYYSEDLNTYGEDSFKIASNIALLSISLGAICVLVYLAMTGFKFNTPVKAILSGLLFGYTGLAIVYSQIKQKYLVYLCFAGFKFPLAIFVITSELFLQNAGVENLLDTFVTFYAVGALATFLIVNSSGGWGTADVSRRAYLMFIRYSFPIVVGTFTAAVITYGSRFVLDATSSETEVAIFAYWQKLSLAYLLVPTAVNTALLPFIYKSMSESVTGFEQRSRLYVKIKSLYAVGAICLISFSSEFSLIISGGSFSQNYFIFSAFIATQYIASSIGASTDLELMFEKRTIFHSSIYFIACVISMVAAYVFSQWFGVVGAIGSSYFSICLVLVAHCVYITRSLRRRINAYPDIVISLCILGVGFFLPILNEYFRYFHIIVGLTACVFCLQRVLIINSQIKSRQQINRSVEYGET